MMVLKNKWKNRFILILFMVGFVFFACKEETDLYFNGDITVIKSFDNDTLLSPVKVELEDIYDGSVLAYDSLLFFTSHKYSDCWMYVFSVNSGKHIASLCPKGQGPNDYLSCKNSQQFIRENGELKLWVRDNAKSARLLNITKSIETGATVCDAIIPMDWNKYFVYPATTLFFLKDGYILGQNQCEEQYSKGKEYIPRNFYLYKDSLGNKVKEYKLFNRPVILKDDKYDVLSGMFYANHSYIHPDQTKVAIAMQRVAQITILDVKSGKQVGYRMDDTLDFSDIEQNLECIRYYYTSAAVNSRYIFALYIDQAEMGGKYPFKSKTVHVFDWEGRPVYKIQLDKEISWITLDPQNNRLYAQGEDDSIWAYDVSWLSK